MPDSPISPLFVSSTAQPSSPALAGKRRSEQHRSVILFCAFCYMLCRLSRQLPWATLSRANRRRLDAAFAALESMVALARTVTRTTPADPPTDTNYH